MRLVLADDHAILLEALAAALKARGHSVVGQALTPEGAVHEVEVRQPDACLLDLEFPQGSGLDVIQEIGRACPDARILILAGRVEPEVVRQALSLGAHGVVDKREPIDHICAALIVAAGGQVAVDPAMLRAAMTVRAPSEDPLWPLRFLTYREWEVLRLIVDGESTIEIAHRLDVRVTTARTHVQNLLTKLGVHSRLQAAALVNQHSERVNWGHHYVSAPPLGPSPWDTRA